MFKTHFIQGAYFLRSLRERLGTFMKRQPYKTLLIPPYYQYVTDDCFVLLRTPHFRSTRGKVILKRVAGLLDLGVDEALPPGVVYIQFVPNGFYFVRVVRIFGRTIREISHEAILDRDAVLDFQELVKTFKVRKNFILRTLNSSSPHMSDFKYRMSCFIFENLTEDEIGNIQLSVDESGTFSLSLEGLTGFGSHNFKKS